MLWMAQWLILLGAHAQDVHAVSEQFVPPSWQGNPWGPGAARARAEGCLPPIVMTSAMTRWDQWGRKELRDGDIVFRMGDARFLADLIPFSRFLAGASGSRFSHSGIIATEGGELVVYDCTKPAVGRTPFAIWVSDNIGAFGVKRLKAERHGAIPGVLAYCRKVFEAQVPFDYSFDLDDSALYCLEMTEKAFRSQGLALSDPVRLGDMENATQYPICISLFESISPLVLKKPLTVEQAVYMPGNGRHGLWGSALLETVYPPPADRTIEDFPRQDDGFSLRGDLSMVACIARELLASIESRQPQDHPVSIASPRTLRGIGVLGDSYSDEYQFASPDRRTARNWVEILSLTRGLDFGRFNATGWSGARRQGFEYNWAQSDATTAGMLAAGQHTELAAQVAHGDVSTIFVLIGGNDFIAAMYAPNPELALHQALPQALANYRIAIRTIRAANPDVQLVLATVPDILLLPEFDGPLREHRLPGRLADACTAALKKYNDQIRAMAAGDRRVALIDLALAARLADLESHDYAVVAGRNLDRRRPGNAPDCFFLADRRHAGTVAQAELARRFVLAVNARFAAGIEPLHDSEIRQLVDGPPDGRADSLTSWSRGRVSLPKPADPGPVGRPWIGNGSASSAR